MSFYVFIITSRDNPLYEEFDKMRRRLMEAKGIPHKFLINGPLPSGYTLKEDEVLGADPSFTPGMFWKFYHACNDLLGAGAEDYIVRVNSSTFLNFDVLANEVIPSLPKERCLAGPYFQEPEVPFPFVSGTVMIFSRDVIADLLTIPVDHPIIPKFYDDAVISYLLNIWKGYPIINLNHFLIVYSAVHSRDYKIYLPDHVAFIRVKNVPVGDRFWNDTYVWGELMRLSGFI